MWESLFETSVVQSLTMRSTLLVLLSALGLGLLISLVYLKNRGREGSSSLAVTLIMLPAIIAVIILLVGNNVARAFSLAGAFSLIRFRSAPGDPKDIAYVFFTLAVGLACGMGYVIYAAVVAAVLCLAIVALDLLKYAQPKATPARLKVTLPEDVDYQGLFDDLFAEYTTSHQLQRVKTVDFGSLFELTYSISLRSDGDQKRFIDQLRCRNGNLKIALYTAGLEE